MKNQRDQFISEERTSSFVTSLFLQHVLCLVRSRFPHSGTLTVARNIATLL